MPAPYSTDLRTRVFAAHEGGGQTYESLAATFRVGIVTVNRWLRRHRERGDVTPAPHGGGQKLRVDTSGEVALRELVRAYPRRHAQRAQSAALLPLEASTRALDARPCPRAAGHHTKKKTLLATERDSDSTRLLRWHFAQLHLERAPERLVFFDESGLNLSLVRLYGRAPTHERVLDDVPKT